MNLIWIRAAPFRTGPRVCTFYVIGDDGCGGTSEFDCSLVVGIPQDQTCSNLRFVHKPEVFVTGLLDVADVSDVNICIRRIKTYPVKSELVSYPCSKSSSLLSSCSILSADSCVIL